MCLAGSIWARVMSNTGKVISLPVSLLKQEKCVFFVFERCIVKPLKWNMDLTSSFKSIKINIPEAL